MNLTFFEDPISNPNPSFLSAASGNAIDWNNVINQSFGVGSQAIAAWGRNPSTQVAYNPANGGIFAIPGPGQVQGQYGQGLTAGQLQQLNYGQQQGTLGSGVGSGLDGALNWVTKNPLLVGAVALGAFLLFKQPPSRR